jgi:rhomboid protease GluP
VKIPLRKRRITALLCSAIGIMFLYQLYVGVVYGHEEIGKVLFAPGDGVLLACGAAYTGMPSSEWPRFISSMFVHGGIIHVVANGTALWQLGTLLEMLFGEVAVLVSFWIGGVLAGISAMALAGSHEQTVYVGASGAIFALAGTLLVGLRRVTKASGGGWSHQLSSRLVGCLGANFLLGLVISAIATWQDLGFVIANSAHAAGLATGIVIGLLIRPKLQREPLPVVQPAIVMPSEARDAGPEEQRSDR